MKWLFLPLQAGKPWNGHTIYESSLGGSESAVAFLARELSRQKHQVFVLTHGPSTVVDGVTYVSNDQRESLGMAEWDVVVSSRWPQALQLDWKTKGRMIWLHDMPVDNLAVRADRIVCISQFQLKQHRFSEDAQVAVIGDGVDETFFEVSQERNENRLIWTSNPDRGLPIAAHVFQEIRKRWPALELHVFGRASTYGWSEQDEFIYLPREQDRENVFLHDSLPRHLLARELAKSWAMFYPTIWPETFCMAALEAQATGTPVIASPYGALPETVMGGVLQYDFLNAVSQLRNKRRWDKLSVTGQEFARQFSWKNIAEQWAKEAEDVISKNGVSV